MGNGVCSRRQRRIFQCLLLVTVVCGLMYGGMISYEMHKQLKRTEAMALKYQQHQESLSAQLQVVYEHRSRLEKSLQKEKLEHKKAKEDYLVYKLEAQQSLNKEKQDSGSRISSLQVQHQMLKNQHDDLKKQYYELQEQHQMQGNDHSRLLDEHRDRYDKLQHAKEAEVAQLKDSVYNLREENKQLRKAHHDIHMQLQDARVRHQDLKTAHDQIALTLEDHKNALAVAQVQVNEYKQLKESLNKAPDMRQPQPSFVHQKPDHKSQQAPMLEPPNKDTPILKDDHDTESRLDQQKDEAHAQSEVQSHPTMSQHSLEEGEAERRRELAEEEMAQAGQPQKLEEEDQDQRPDEEQLEDDEEGEPKLEQPDENALDSHIHEPQKEVHPQHEPHIQGVGAKSAYEQQQEQQRLEAQRAKERRLIQMQQDALQAQRERVLREREVRLKDEQEREKQHHQEADRREQLLREEQQRKKAEYENLDHDIVQREEAHPADNEEERHAHLIHEDKVKAPQHQQVAIDGRELDPEDDPNNQGEDEFEEAEDEQSHHRDNELDEVVEEEVEEEEPAARAQHVDSHPGLQHPAMEDELVIAGNPDQQEDNLDEQYQEEAEEEAQEDIAGGEKKEKHDRGEEDGDDAYNEENMEQGPHKEETHGKDAENIEEENYEEEEADEDGVGGDKGTNQRAEM
ncbi:Golgi integral membrane protein 4a [Dunckerocampus dactyliophorus]|uniref:Golgi integral membrane protein 4a n=1 Tax=Dunckerocampus dactyliophorus TaxID=161453 RepID=UPI002404BCCA|nr:Golgi integral membrane protein 4a [Dunckerocampus dactyliophorus]